MNGLLNLLKPPGMTSHDAVAVVRRLTGAKVGHTGTLDPLAAGVLILTVGAATRLTDLLALHDKTYRAEIILGLETDTLDLEGQVLRQVAAPDVTPEQVVAALAGLTGELEMVPPMFSAVKQGGRKLYDLARQGREVARAPRPVTVWRFELLEFTPGNQPRCLCEIACSKGTYVRSLAEMLGRRLGCGACLGFLLRTAQGPHRIAEALTLEEVAERAAAGRLQKALTPLHRALPDVPLLPVTAELAQRLCQGNAVEAEGAGVSGTVMVTCGEEPVCLAEAETSGSRLRLRPRKVFPRSP
jgi:tRNA pseudouridine55 synthase